MGLGGWPWATATPMTATVERPASRPAHLVKALMRSSLIDVMKRQLGSAGYRQDYCATRRAASGPDTSKCRTGTALARPYSLTRCTAQAQPLALPLSACNVPHI